MIKYGKIFLRNGKTRVKRRAKRMRLSTFTFLQSHQNRKKRFINVAKTLSKQRF